MTWEDVERERERGKKKKAPIDRLGWACKFTHTYVHVYVRPLAVYVCCFAPPPFMLGEQGNEKEVMASEQEACASHSATAVVFCCCHSVFESDCLLKPSACSLSPVRNCSCFSPSGRPDKSAKGVRLIVPLQEANRSKVASRRVKNDVRVRL